MPGSLGEKIGEGAFSEAYAWAPGQVVKLFRPGVSRLMARHEVRMLRAVHAAGVPVPEVFGEVTLDGRFGIVLQRLDGPTLMQQTRTGAVSFEQSWRMARVNWRVPTPGSGSRWSKLVGFELCVVAWLGNRRANGWTLEVERRWQATPISASTWAGN